MAAPYESAGYRSLVTQIVIGANILGFLLLIVWDALDAVYGPTPSDAFTLIDAVDLVAVLVFYGTLVAAIVFFCMWLHRIVRNMPALGSPDPRWSPARAVVYCFIPFLNLVHPLWSVLDASRGADPSRRWLDRAARRTIRAPILLASWWALWLIGGYVSRIALRTNGTGGDILDMVANVIGIGAAVLCVLVIRDVTARQERKNQLIASGQLV